MNVKGQAGTEAILVVSLLLIVFVILGVMTLQQGSQTALLESNLDKENTCIQIATVLTQTYFAGPGTTWSGKLENKDANIYTSGFVEVTDEGGSEQSVSCTYLGSVDQNYFLTPGTLTFENRNGNVVVTLG